MWGIRISLDSLLSKRHLTKIFLARRGWKIAREGTEQEYLEKLEEIEYKDIAEFAREFEKRRGREGNSNSIAEEIYRESGGANRERLQNCPKSYPRS
ncbi:MAG: hypothetical protein ACRC8M_05165 [Cetobacterium sp.]|uniref:hypothetical protein n=1 Tax=Cetobacterium sp. TaxID=2071632 RepID=UPI003F2B233F